MHVGLNLIFLVPGQTGGMEVAARALIPALRAAAPGARFTAFVNREAAAEDLGVERVVVPVRASRRIEWVRGEQQLLPGLARRAGCDVVHSLASTAPARGRFARVTTIHDLNYLVVPDAHFGLRGLGMRVLVPLAARTAHRVLADSASTRDDLVARLGIAADKIDVVALGLGQPAVAAPTPADELRARLALGARRVVLSLSAKRPHKNLRRLIDAVALIPAERRPVLVLPGYPTPHEAELREHARATGVEADVRFLGWTARGRRRGPVRRSRRAFAFPSLYEGFGLPVLEAMARGVPVACADRASLPEVAGDAALLFDPESAGGDRRRARAAARGSRRGRTAAGRGPRARGAVHVGADRRRDAGRLRARDRRGGAVILSRVLGNRPLGFVARNAVQPENWRALARMARVYPRFPENAWRYFTARGRYPYDCAVRTPLGTLRPRLWTAHDMLTVNEVFCRLDYAAPPGTRVVVDVGSNIGISALYFLSRGPDVRCYLHEPVAQNVERLRHNLAPFADRWTLAETAVWDRDGSVEFGVEPTGRYSGIGVAAPARVEVPCVSIDSALETVLEREERIDVLKIDTEGVEIETVAAIRPDLLDRIHTIYFETTDRPALHGDRFERSFACDTCRLVNRALAA